MDLRFHSIYSPGHKLAHPQRGIDFFGDNETNILIMPPPLLYDIALFVSNVILTRPGSDYRLTVAGYGR